MKKFLVWDVDNPDGIESAAIVEAIDAEHAAREYGEEGDVEGDYYLAAGGTCTLSVVEEENPDAKPKKFQVSAEASVDYYAEEVE